MSQPIHKLDARSTLLPQFYDLRLISLVGQNGRTGRRRYC